MADVLLADEAQTPYALGERTYEVKFDDEKHKYWIGGEPVISVTQVLKILPNDALPWWGMRVGMAAVVELLNQERIGWPQLLAHRHAEVLSGVPVHPDSPTVAGKDGKLKTLLEDLVVKAGLSINSIRDDAAAKGTAMHDALELMLQGEFPDIADYALEERPRLQALSKWWLEHDDMEILAVEQIVGSRAHMFAGRFDLLCRDHDTDQVVLRDLKRTKGIYPDTHFRQLAGYVLAWEEMQSYLPPERRVHIDRAEIINLPPSGEPAVGVSYAIAEDFLAVLRMSRAQYDFEIRGRKKLRRAR